MDLIRQIQGIGYSLVYGFVFTFVYSLINRLLYKYHQCIIRLFLQIIIGIIFGYIYYLGLLRINNGVIRIYFFVSMLIGYIENKIPLTDMILPYEIMERSTV